MNKTIVAALLSIASLTASAESFSEGSLAFEVNGGSIIGDSYSVNALTSAADTTKYVDEQKTFFSSAIDYDLTQGSSVAQANTTSSKASASAFTNGGYASTDLTTFFQVNYVAGTTLTFSALVNTSASTKAANSYGDISYSVLDDGYFVGRTFSNQVSSVDGIGQLISLSYSSNQNQVLQLSTHLFVDAAQEVNVSPVPEPMTYAMMLAGLTLITVATKHRKS